MNSEYSMQLNASRIKVLQAQDEVVNSMKDDAKKALLHISNDEQVYKKLIKEIIVQVFKSFFYTSKFCHFHKTQIANNKKNTGFNT